MRLTVTHCDILATFWEIIHCFSESVSLQVDKLPSLAAAGHHLLKCCAVSMPRAGDTQKLRGSQNLRKMSSPAVVGSTMFGDVADSGYYDDRLSPLSFAAASSHLSGRRQTTSRASFSTLDQLPSELPSTPSKKGSSTPKSGLPRPSSASKLPLQCKSVLSWFSFGLLLLLL